MSLLRLPGLIDPHVHLREPGYSLKEDFYTGTCAALAGGFTTVLDMPNTLPPTSNLPRLKEKAGLAAAKIVCDVGLFVAATNDGVATDTSIAGAYGCGLKIYVSETFGNLRIDSLETLSDFFRTWRGPGPIAVHAEDMMLATCIALAEIYQQDLHVVHVSRCSEIELIKRAKEKGKRVTCEVTPHHLFLTEQDGQHLGPYGLMRPALASKTDVAALWANIDVIDCIATDHAPHTREEKESNQPPPGVPGLETALPLMLQAVEDGRLTLEDMVTKMHTNPARIYHLAIPAQTYIEVDTSAHYHFPARGWHTRADWSPFVDHPATGKVTKVVLRGETVYQNGEILANPGQGKLAQPLDS